MSFWKILRVLVADGCNYQCQFCHNEGQTKQRGKNLLMPFDGFRSIIESLQGSGIKDIQFSGGEPFLNPWTIQMIEFIQAETTWEIGCATNGQLITEDIAARIGKTRTRLNINLPSIDPVKFRDITGGGSLLRLNTKISLLEKYKVDYGYNSVLQAGESLGMMDLINNLSQQGKRLKILPYLNTRHPLEQPLDSDLIEFIESLAEISSIQPTSHRWTLKDRGGGKSVIKYVDFPCRRSDIKACRNYAEVRLLPDFQVQTCLINPNRVFQIDKDLNLFSTKKQIREVFERAWMGFTTC